MTRPVLRFRFRKLAVSLKARYVNDVHLLRFARATARAPSRHTYSEHPSASHWASRAIQRISPPRTICMIPQFSLPCQLLQSEKQNPLTIFYPSLHLLAFYIISSCSQATALIAFHTDIRSSPKNLTTFPIPKKTTPQPLSRVNHATESKLYVLGLSYDPRPPVGGYGLRFMKSPLQERPAMRP